MAGHESEDWFEREEMIGQISDIRVQNLQGEREQVQKRTFTRWINLHLEKCTPPMEVHDLFQDIQDGRILMALLEELSGSKLLHGFKKSSHRIFRLNNIAKVLSFLEERNVKLVSIDASDVADGNPSIILGLIWNIILFFQIKELTGNIKSQFPSSSSLSSVHTSSDSDTSHSSMPSEERRLTFAPVRGHGTVIKKLLQWVQKRTRKYGVAVQDFGKSWTSGLAFLAVIKSIDSTLVDMRRALLRTSRENVEEAFRTAHYSLGIPRLLEPEDVTINPPDEQSIMTYVAQFLEHFPGTEEPEEPRLVIERSISMGRLSSCDSDSSLIKNGIHPGFLRERPHTVHKNWVKPPRKILISSMSMDKGVFSPTTTVRAHSWASEDSLEKSAPGEDVSPSMGDGVQDPGQQINTTPSPTSPLSSYIHSPICSSVCESVISDSAIGSPDSWMEGEVRMTPEMFSESPSDSSLCDSNTAWDLSGPLTNPGEITAVDEGLSPLSIGNLMDEQSAPKMFVDEGIYLMSSMESTLERIHIHSDKEEDNKEEKTNRYVQDVNHDGVCDHVSSQKEPNKDKTNGDSEQMDISQSQRDLICGEHPSYLGPSDEINLNFCEADHVQESERTSQSQSTSNQKTLTSDLFEELEGEDDVKLSSQRGLGHAREAVELNEDTVHHVGQLCVSKRNGSAVEPACEGNSEGKVREKGTSEEKPSKAQEDPERQEEANQRVLNGLTDPQAHTGTESHDFTVDTHPEQLKAIDQSLTNQDGAAKPGQEHSTSLSMTKDQTGEAENRTLGTKRESQTGGKDVDLTGSSGDQQETYTDANNVTLDEQSCTSTAEEGDKATDSALLGGLLADKFKPAPSEHTGELACQDPVDVNQQDTVSSSVTDSAGSEVTGDVEMTGTQQTYSCLYDDRTTTEIIRLDSCTLVQPTGTEEQSVGFDLAESESDATVQLDCQQVKMGTLLTVKQAAMAQLNPSIPDNSWSHWEMGSVGYSWAGEHADMDLFYADAGRSSPLEELVGEQLEPMDMFYPDKEEAMYSEPPKEDAERRRSVFNLSVLQPAPVPETFPETHTPQDTCRNGLTETDPPLKLDQGLKDTVCSATQEQEITESCQEAMTSSGAQEELWSVGGMMGEDGGDTASGRAKLCDLSMTRAGSPRSARENINPLRNGAEGHRSPDDNLDSSRLQHRLLADPSDSVDSWTEVSTVDTHAEDSDPGRRQSSLPVTDLYMLLLLWLLLYCLWVLPQIDLCTLPRLLLNLDH